MRPRHLVLLGLLAGCAPAASTAGPETLRLVFPAACRVGQTCEIQTYVDRDPGPGVSDYRCLSRSYEEHGGIDIRLPDLAAQRAGVEVLAAAAGTVLRARDGAAEASVGETGVAAVEGRECGNGAVLDHGDGWQTQYCHLAAGSVRVQPGQSVAAGQPIGRIGLSGLTEYPHLHFTVRRNGAVVDPFAPAPGRTCEAQAPLWTPQALEQLPYKRGAVLNAGFTSAAVEMKALESRALPAATAASPALVAYVRAIGLETGDVQELTLRAPDGAVLATRQVAPLARPRAQQLVFVGKRRPAAGWPEGAYRASYVVRREGRPAVQRNFEIVL